MTTPRRAPFNQRLYNWFTPVDTADLVDDEHCPAATVLGARQVCTVQGGKHTVIRDASDACDYKDLAFILYRSSVIVDHDLPYKCMT